MKQMVVEHSSICNKCSFCIEGKQLTSYQRPNTKFWQGKDPQVFVNKYCGHAFHKVCAEKILTKYKKLS